ncbi:hypothetical protein IW140_006061 [Coemansia sp. RSA 1813]|nr:hypothetical protein EV178_005418 [Coemansia sp. RSA 1646]KAJ1766258.1 hypothetical protein LPJ74_005976 [Coemansia sp. RSA 1843]KAJ2085903.1 hypothetical protein IW138_006039 [Coemansia sp. RSA 986]KAJ2214399.1 hypothetical protein EV179_003064 [Coemansia sp. RSA 487]KAJ2563575.1 hypothetical protein IW140_006061 [Coemansia sp. RSA 1813]
MNFRGILAFIAAFVAFVAVTLSAPTPETGIALPGSGEAALSWLNRLLAPLPIVGPLTKALGIAPPPPPPQQKQPQKKPQPQRKPQRKPQRPPPQRKPAAPRPQPQRPAARPQQRRPAGPPQPQQGKPAAAPNNPLGLSPAALSGMRSLGMLH